MFLQDGLLSSGRRVTYLISVQLILDDFGVFAWNERRRVSGFSDVPRQHHAAILLQLHHFYL